MGCTQASKPQSAASYCPVVVMTSFLKALLQPGRILDPRGEINGGKKKKKKRLWICRDRFRRVCEGKFGAGSSVGECRRLTTTYLRDYCSVLVMRIQLSKPRALLRSTRLDKLRCRVRLDGGGEGQKATFRRRKTKRGKSSARGKMGSHTIHEGREHDCAHRQQ